MHQALIQRIKERAGACLPTATPPTSRRSSGVYLSPSAETFIVNVDEALRVKKVGEYAVRDAIRARDGIRKSIKRADGIVAEITVLSADVAMKLEMAITERKPVLCLFRPILLVMDHRFPDLLTGSPFVTISCYQDGTPAGTQELDQILDEFLARFRKRAKLAKAGTR